MSKKRVEVPAASLRFVLSLGLCGLLLNATGCGANSPAQTPDSGEPTTPGSSGTSDSGTDSGSGTDAGSEPVRDAGFGCVGTGSTAEPQDVDIFIMLDRSISMAGAAGNTTKWAAVTSALSSFVGQSLDRTSVGLQYFPIHVGSADSCQAADYAKPEVEIGPLAQTASAIKTSISLQQKFLTGTPTSAALQGAINHARDWAGMPAHAGHAVVVALVTDGEPIDCDVNLANIYAIAAAGLSGAPSIRTFVIGVGRSLTNLQGIAIAGGTTSAFMVDTSSTASDEFLKALNGIRGSAIGCNYAIPSAPVGQTLDFGMINVEFQPGSGPAVSFGQIQDAASCGTKANAWYYDNASAPTAIRLCPSTCSAIQSDKAATVKTVLGCKTAEIE